MKTFGKLVMVSMAVSEKAGSKEFYTEKLGFSITSDYRRDEANWWVSLELPAGGTSVTLSTVRENMEPGTMKLYLSTPDIREAHKQLTAKGVEIRGEINDDLYGPGSGVRWFSIYDPDGNHWIVLQL